MSSTLGFYGGVGMVTGANFMLDLGEVKALVDCGLVQGDRFAQKVNAEPFAYQPQSVDFLFITHAHADHIGRIPKLVREGFTGTIYATKATRALAEVMLHDALKVMEFEHERYGVKPIYSEVDIDAAMSHWQGVDYDETIDIGDRVAVHFENVGHILGSASVHFVRDGKQVVFTGDIGNIPQPLLDEPVKPTNYDYMVMESVYGDRKHEEVAERTQLLLNEIQATIARKGTLIIPAFSLERTQAMLMEINNFVESGTIEPLPVFLDSPLAIEVTEIYRRYANYMKPEIQQQIKNGDDIFDFDGLSFTRSQHDSHAIESAPNPKIIIAGSGMSHGGRIREHEKHYLDDKNATVLLVGYQAVGSLGRLLQDGAKRVKIDDTWTKVRARIANITGYSGHADRDQLVDFVAPGGAAAKQIFVTMGEERSSLFLVQRLRDYLDAPAVAPALNQKVPIDF